jgi:3-oxoacyl-[acyl-carrier-protein] synthase II
MSVYIQGIGNISIQNTFGTAGFPDPLWYNEPYVRCVDPDFKSFISPNEARRMSKVIKRAIATAKTAIADSGIEMPDAIISGTGLGCIEDTEKFLSAMIDNEEKFLQPTFFIQSTHNTISSQIAINLKCHGHNNTFVQGGVSFENALNEAMLLFADNKINTALVGGHDEMTPAYFKLLNRIDFWKKEINNSAELFNSGTPGSLAGEGSVSVMLSNCKNDKTYACIDDLQLLYRPENIELSIQSFLQKNGKNVSDIDLVIPGMNGDSENDAVYKAISSSLFNDKPQAAFKHLSGEYFTSAGFGCWFAANCIRHNTVPPLALLNGRKVNTLRNVLMINHYQNKNYSLTLFSA